MSLDRPPNLTVVVPVFNEARTVREALERLLKANLPLPVDVVVVDDGSTDGSAEAIADLLSSGRAKVRLVRHDRNRGKGAAIRTGIARASGDLLTVLDADLEYSPDDLKALLRPILDGEARVVYGTRTYQSHTAYSFWYVVGNRVVNLWASFLFNRWVNDLETCLKVTYTELWRRMRLRSSGFGIEPEITAKLLRAGERIHEMPVNYRARTRDEGKKLRWTDGVMALLILLRVRLLGD